MMINYLGHSCFKIQSNSGVTLVTDPYNSDIGLKLPNFEANIITVTHDHGDHNNVKASKGSPYIISLPGEYDISDILVEGILSKHGGDKGENIIYRIEVDGITLCHLGDLGEALNEKQLDHLNAVDILFIPVGGKNSLNVSQAMEVVNQLEPRIVVPMHYNVPGLKIDGLADVEKFIKESGLKPRYEEKIKLNKKDLPVEDTELVILSA